MQVGCLSASLMAMAPGLVVPIFIISGSSGLRLAFLRSLFRGLFLLSNQELVKEFSVPVTIQLNSITYLLQAKRSAFIVMPASGIFCAQH